MPKKGGKRNGKSRAGAGPSKGIRVCEEEGEQFGVVTQMLGGPNCRVACQDGQVRMCVIRSKFRWRNKRHNRLAAGSWVMVGVRTWETTAKGEQRCDLLEVYSDGDAGKLESVSGADLSALRRMAGAARPGAAATGGHDAGTSANTERSGQDVVFTDEVEADIDTRQLQGEKVDAVTFGAGDDDDEIDLDEI